MRRAKAWLAGNFQNRINTHYTFTLDCRIDMFCPCYINTETQLFGFKTFLSNPRRLLRWFDTTKGPCRIEKVSTSPTYSSWASYYREMKKKREPMQQNKWQDDRQLVRLRPLLSKLVRLWKDKFANAVKEDLVNIPPVFQVSFFSCLHFDSWKASDFF